MFWTWDEKRLWKFDRRTTSSPCTHPRLPGKLPEYVKPPSPFKNLISISELSDAILPDLQYLRSRLFYCSPIPPIRRSLPLTSNHPLCHYEQFSFFCYPQAFSPNAPAGDQSTTLNCVLGFHLYLSRHHMIVKPYCQFRQEPIRYPPALACRIKLPHSYLAFLSHFKFWACFLSCPYSDIFFPFQLNSP